MIHELRIYEAVPGRLPALLKRFETDTVPRMKKHGFAPLGFWTTVIGESNQTLYYILGWTSLEERKAKMRAFGSDPEWLAVRDRTERDGPLVANVANTIMAPTAFSPTR